MVCVGVMVGPDGSGVLVDVAIVLGINVAEGEGVQVGVMLRVGTADAVKLGDTRTAAVALARFGAGTDGVSVSRRLGRTVGTVGIAVDVTL